MSINPVDYLVHFSNILMLVAYSVKDILWLRWFAVAAALTNIPYFLMQPTRLWPPILWAAVFTIINFYQIVVIYRERRPVVLSEDEQALYKMGFGSLRPREFVTLLMAGEWKTAAPGEAALIQGKPVSTICIALSGALTLLRDGKEVMPIKPGQLIGTALALTEEISPVGAVFTEPTRYFRWPVNGIRSFLEKRPDLRIALQSLVNRDLAEKIAELSTYLPGRE
jgi:CRP-like cAMP-binding protein